MSDEYSMLYMCVLHWHFCMEVCCIHV